MELHRALQGDKVYTKATEWNQIRDAVNWVNAQIEGSGNSQRGNIQVLNSNDYTRAVGDVYEISGVSNYDSANPMSVPIFTGIGIADTTGLYAVGLQSAVAATGTIVSAQTEGICYASVNVNSLTDKWAKPSVGNYYLDSCSTQAGSIASIIYMPSTATGVTPLLIHLEKQSGSGSTYTADERWIDITGALVSHLPMPTSDMSGHAYTPQDSYGMKFTIDERNHITITTPGTTPPTIPTISDLLPSYPGDGNIYVLSVTSGVLSWIQVKPGVCPTGS
jgi:hypothetical protein